MKKQYILGLAVFILAFVILTVSVMRTVTVSYITTSPSRSATVVLGAATENIDYKLPFPGSVLPDSPLWYLKALRDKIWYTLTTNPEKKAELALLFSDKRLAASVILLDENKPGLALSTLSKGEKYLELSTSMEKEAKEQGMDTSAFLTRLALASLKHRQIIEENILPLSPDDAKPGVNKAENYARDSYKVARDGLNDLGLTPPIDPFDGQ